MLVRYNPLWPVVFEHRKNILSRCLGKIELSIDHIGSTSVVGLTAKPIIDILVASPSLKVKDFVISQLHGLGYDFREDFRRRIPDALFFQLGPREWRTEHLYLVSRGGEQWSKFLAFRDYLQDHPGARKEYRILKRRLAELYPRNRKAYTKGKSAFVEEMLAIAFKNGYPRNQR